MGPTPVPEPAELFDQHYDAVYAYFAYRLAPRWDVVGDLSQDVFAAALTALDQLRHQVSARSWLLQIARHKLSDHFRAARRMGVVLKNVRDQPTRRQGGDQELQDRALHIATVLRTLPDRQRGLLEDKYLRGLSVRDMAISSGSSEKAVESALVRARRSFELALRQSKSTCGSEQ